MSIADNTRALSKLFPLAAKAVGSAKGITGFKANSFCIMYGDLDTKRIVGVVLEYESGTVPAMTGADPDPLYFARADVLNSLTKFGTEVSGSGIFDSKFTPPVGNVLWDAPTKMGTAVGVFVYRENKQIKVVPIAERAPSGMSFG